MPTYNAQVSFRIRDTAGVERNLTQNAEITFTTVAELETLMETMAEKLDAPLLGRVVNSTVTIETGVNANVKPAPADDSFVGSGGSVSFIDTNGGANPIFIPTLARSKFINDVLDQSDSEVQTMLNMWIAGNNVNGGASVDFQDDDRRKFTQFATGKPAKKGVFVTRKYRGG
ncbi:MAG: hypothetical protein KJ064_27845 [Anaerolineae bacterium]|nr:hypothetical protein [Anaerolineae bacterium]